ncbi:Uu.00g106970.m01.CDS01 [Anthostomella pinea]|uniref:Uu.00g106970.m01.CDS01 n=1 Tax=Anthostomella pinea TaxID=933095 RepID=A0AAI8VEA3_9PEZI|nr:Uu.00g106970.m01.CDS01 [Anthostomella pinea]
MSPVTQDLEAIAVSSVELAVPTLGRAKGLCYDGNTCQYLGIPFATIPGRFRRPRSAPTPWPDHVLDATTLGPYCPQPPRDFYPIPVPPQRPWAAAAPSTSSTECLNLNISVPFPPQDPRLKGLPVMVFFHGGAFAYAAGSAAIYDGRVLADVSRDEAGSPAIIISLNYRLGVLGFLASKEIREYNASFGEEGVGNYGIWDQVEALRWVKQHISAFGGDPDRITAFGQSAGGVSVNAHILRDEPLFSGAILQSGLLPLCGIMSESEYQVLYEKMLQTLGCPMELSPQDRLTYLLNVSEEDLIAAMVPVFIAPVITMALCDDGVLIPGKMPSWSDFNSVKAPSWCPRVMVGDAANECIIWNKAFRHHDGASVTKLAASFFAPDQAKKILDLYSISSETPKAEVFDKIEKMTTDAILAPNYDFMRANPHCYAYHFDEPSRYDNEWGGLAHHSLENIYIWNVLRHTLPPAQQKQAARMAALWLRFASGDSPWPAFGHEQSIMLFGGGEATLSNPSQDARRGYSRWESIRDLGGKDLIESWGEFAFQLCILKRELLDPSFEMKAMEVEPLARKVDERQEPGVL